MRALPRQSDGAHMPSFLQELLLVLAHITNSQGGAQMIEFLISCGGGANELSYVANQWLENLPCALAPSSLFVIEKPCMTEIYLHV